ncbi:MAG: protein-glutamate O-methyltransferase CheR [Labilithrix sp.]
MAVLSPQLFVLLGSLVEERAGLHYAPDDRSVFAEKVHARMTEAGFESPLDYYYFLRYDERGGDELNTLVDALVVNETYLFREVDALIAAMSTVIRPAIAERGRARVWSAGCATGEEPFTLAMLCAEEGHLPRVELTATDISSRALARARAGQLSGRALRSVGNPPWTKPLADRFVHEGRMSSAITSAITFQRESLIGTEPSRNDLDLILCRNVLIYFRDEVVRSVVEMLAARLRPGGRLLVGASESLLRFGTFLQCEERGGAFFYVRPG